MGSYNQTCAVTHAPIEGDDPVVGFILANSYGRGTEAMEGWTGSSTLWQPVSLPFEGAYDDYGSVELGEHAIADASLRNVAGIGLAELLDIGREGDEHEAVLGGPYGKSKLKLMLVHREVYDRMTASAPRTVGPDAVAAEEEPELLAFLDAMEESHAKEWPAVHPTLPKFDHFGSLGECVERWSRHTGRSWTQAPFVAQFFNSGRDGAHPLLVRSVKGALEDARTAGDRDALLALLKPALAVAIFSRNMEGIRRAWMPQVGLGQQDEDFGLHAELADWTARTCRRKADPDAEFDEVAAPAP